MSIQDLQAEIITIDQKIAQLKNSVSPALVKKLLNLIERVVKENNTLLTERQQLRDEINRLKGEQGKLDIKANNVNYRTEVYYSASTNKSYRGELPAEVRGKGEYGPGIRALIPILKAEGNMSEKRILGFFQNFGIEVSATYISQQWTGGYTLFHQEKSDLYRSGITASDYVQIDDTSARVNGTIQYCQIVCSPLFTAYFTTPKSDRLTVLSVLTDFMPHHYLYNESAKRLLDIFKLADKARVTIDAQLPAEIVMNESEFNAQLTRLDTLGSRQSVHLTEACTIAYYQQQTDFPIIERLLANDAPQFKLLTLYLALCWIHDARHYKKLKPFISLHQQALAGFRSLYWAYYSELLKYKREPAPDKKEALSKRFDALLATTTDYEELNERIIKSLDKKTALLHSYLCITTPPSLAQGFRRVLVM